MVLRDTKYSKGGQTLENKAGMIVRTLIEKLKKNTHFFGELAVVETHGTHASRAEIALQSGDKTDVYSVIVIKHASC